MSFQETFNTSGEQLLKKIKELIAEGNVRKISISDKSGQEIMSFPVTFGVVGVVLLPIFAAVGAAAAVLTECKITVVRDQEHTPKAPSSGSHNPKTPTDI